MVEQRCGYGAIAASVIARKADSLALEPLVFNLERLLGKPVDLINLRQVSTVFRKEIIMADRRIDCRDQYAADEFEILTLSFYQKLNQEQRAY